jgi:hypothetical protein
MVLTTQQCATFPPFRVSVDQARYWEVPLTTEREILGATALREISNMVLND